MIEFYSVNYSLNMLRTATGGKKPAPAKGNEKRQEKSRHSLDGLFLHAIFWDAQETCGGEIFLRQ